MLFVQGMNKKIAGQPADPTSVKADSIREMAERRNSVKHQHKEKGGSVFSLCKEEES